MECSFIKENGTKCRSNAQFGKELCFRHDPDNHLKALEASKKGGSNRALYLNQKRVELKTPDDIKALIGGLISETLQGIIPLGAGGPLVYMCKIWLDAHEAGDVERKLEKFEKLVEKIGA